MDRLKQMVEHQEKVLSVLKSKTDLINDIAVAVCDQFNISVSEIGMKSRRRKYVNPRAAFCYLVFKQKRHEYTLNEVKLYINQEAHATVLNSLKNANDWLVSDKNFAERLIRAEKNLPHLFAELNVSDRACAVDVINKLIEQVAEWLSINKNNPFSTYMEILKAELLNHKKHLTND